MSKSLLILRIPKHYIKVSPLISPWFFPMSWYSDPLIPLSPRLTLWIPQFKVLLIIWFCHLPSAFCLLASVLEKVSPSPCHPLYHFRFRIPQLVLRSGSLSPKSEYHLCNQRWLSWVVSTANLPRRMDPHFAISYQLLAIGYYLLSATSYELSAKN